jgi:hypothetical protein
VIEDNTSRSATLNTCGTKAREEEWTNDLRKERKHLYGHPPESEIVNCQVQFVMIGEMEVGNRGFSQAFQEAMRALYGAAYTLKFMSSCERKTIDCLMTALEGFGGWIQASLT